MNRLTFCLLFSDEEVSFEALTLLQEKQIVKLIQKESPRTVFLHNLKKLQEQNQNVLVSVSNSFQ
jgi:chromosome condensin MukBEF MukE localization factor